MTWERSTMTAAGPGRMLVILSPRVALSYRRAAGYVITGQLADIRAGMSLGAVLDWCTDNGIPKPSTADLAWVEYR